MGLQDGRWCVVGGAGVSWARKVAKGIFVDRFYGLERGGTIK